jgi:hypothetical protein
MAAAFESRIPQAPSRRHPRSRNADVRRASARSGRAACLEQEGHACKVFDLRIEGEEQGLALCRTFDPDVVGLQCNFTTERNRTIRLAERIKREMPRAFVLVGGHDASRDPEWFRNKSIDAIAIDGEEVMPPPMAGGRDTKTVPGSDADFRLTRADARTDEYPLRRAI